MRQKYIILKAYDHEELEKKVLQLMELNYVALGGVSVTKSGGCTFYVQAMELL